MPPHARSAHTASFSIRALPLLLHMALQQHAPQKLTAILFPFISPHKTFRPPLTFVARMSDTQCTLQPCPTRLSGSRTLKYSTRSAESPLSVSDIY